MYPDFKEFLSVLNDHNVKYLVVGGYAVSEYAQPRTTKDLDVFIQATKRNAGLLLRAMREFGAPLHDLSADDLIQKGKFFTMGVAPVAIDILNEIDGVSFSTAWRNRTSRLVDEPTGLIVHFISIDDLIEAKLAAGRARDLADAEELRKARSTTPTAKRQATRAKRKPLRKTKPRRL